MRIMSCNGCRALRKGCSNDCTLSPCLEWIKSPESQSNATLFLAKFYGRAGLINLINGAPNHLRPEIFRSLLYEACGRIINPIYGSVGLVCSGNWQRCHTAVEAVLQGSPLVTMGRVSRDHDSRASAQVDAFATLQRCDIRHVSKESAAALHRVRNRKRFKRSSSKSHSMLLSEPEAKFTITGWDYYNEDCKGFGEELNRSPSQDSMSGETLESVLVNRVQQPVRVVKPEPQIGLELTLGFNPLLQRHMSTVIEISDSES